MQTSNIRIPEEEVSVAVVADIFRAAGYEIYDQTEKYFFVNGSSFLIQIGLIREVKSVCFYIVRPLPQEISYTDCIKVANDLNLKYDFARFYIRESGTGTHCNLIADFFLPYSPEVMPIQILHTAELVENFLVNATTVQDDQERRLLWPSYSAN